MQVHPAHFELQDRPVAEGERLDTQRELDGDAYGHHEGWCEVLPTVTCMVDRYPLKENPQHPTLYSRSTWRVSEQIVNDLLEESHLHDLMLEDFYVPLDDDPWQKKTRVRVA